MGSRQETRMADAVTELGGRRPGDPVRRDRILIGSSAGGLDTLRAIAGYLPRDFPQSIFVVAHVGQSRSTLPELLGKPAVSPLRIRARKSPSERITFMWRRPIAIC